MAESALHPYAFLITLFFRVIVSYRKFLPSYVTLSWIFGPWRPLIWHLLVTLSTTDWTITITKSEKFLACDTWNQSSKSEENKCGFCFKPNNLYPRRKPRLGRSLPYRKYNTEIGSIDQSKKCWLFTKIRFGLISLNYYFLVYFAHNEVCSDLRPKLLLGSACWG